MSKKLMVGVYDQEPRLYTRIKADIEIQLRRLSNVEIIPVDSVSSPIASLDLLIVVAPPLHDESFEKWLTGIESRLSTPAGIWIPCLMIADVDFQDLNAIMKHAADSNWYFDITNPAHLSSLPIRVANLTRINSHIKELKNYDRVVRDLSQKVEELEAKIQAFSIGEKDD